MPEKKAMRSCYPSVEELLALEPFEGSIVVAGKRGLKRMVTGVNLSDTPNYYNWLSANEMIATTCYAIHDNPEAIEAFVPTVHAKKLSCIFLKPKQFLGSMPKIMVDQAETLGIPLVELPDSVRLSSIVKAVFDEITRRETLVLKQSMHVNRMLIQTILGGADLESIAGMLSEQVGASIIILDTVNHRRAVHIASADRRAFSGLGMEETVIKLMNGAREYPMIADNASFGNIYIYNKNKEISKTNELLLSQSMSAVPLEISGRQSMNEMRKRDFSAYIFHLFSDPITDMKWEERRAEEFGIRSSDAHAVLRMRITNGQAFGKGKGVFQRAQFISAVKYALNGLELGLHMLETDGEVIFILDVLSTQPDFEKLSERIRQSVADVCAHYERMTVTGGIGTIHAGIPSLIKSNRQAELSMKIAGRTGKSILSFDELGFLRMIYSENPEYEIYDYVREVLRDLIDENHARNAELLGTLECYLKNRGNVRQVSKEMYAHYNTVSYRLKKIEEITGRKLDDPDDRFLLDLATRLLRVTSAAKPRA